MNIQNFLSMVVVVCERVGLGAKCLTALESSQMASNATRLARLFTPFYASRVNAQLIYPATSAVVKPDELASALMRPLQTATYEPHQSPEYLAATLAFGIIIGKWVLGGGNIANARLT